MFQPGKSIWYTEKLGDQEKTPAFNSVWACNIWARSMYLFYVCTQFLLLVLQLIGLLACSPGSSGHQENSLININLLFLFYLIFITVITRLSSMYKKVTQVQKRTWYYIITWRMVKLCQLHRIQIQNNLTNGQIVSTSLNPDLEKLCNKKKQNSTNFISRKW